jgi:hypothetical protein
MVYFSSAFCGTVERYHNNNEEKHMALAWFDAKQSKEFGTALANFFIEKIPVENNQNVDEEYFARKTKKTLAAMEAQVVEFKKNNKLNVYKRAQLGNTFKWTLKNAGYAEDYINELTMWLVKQL